MYNSRLDGVLDKIDYNREKAENILGRVEKLYGAKCIDGDDRVFLGNLKYRIESNIKKLTFMKQTLMKNVYSDDSHLFYYEKEIDDIGVYLNNIDIQ